MVVCIDFIIIGWFCLIYWEFESYKGGGYCFGRKSWERGLYWRSLLLGRWLFCECLYLWEVFDECVWCFGWRVICWGMIILWWIVFFLLFYDVFDFFWIFKVFIGCFYCFYNCNLVLGLGILVGLVLFFIYWLCN